MNTYIHLLYVPTMACNMACSYCYLEDQTKDLTTGHSPLETLTYAVDKCREENIIPFNISLHGGEVTCLKKEEFREIKNAQGPGPPHFIFSTYAQIELLRTRKAQAPVSDA